MPRVSVRALLDKLEKPDQRYWFGCIVPGCPNVMELRPRLGRLLLGEASLGHVHTPCDVANCHGHYDAMTHAAEGPLREAFFSQEALYRPSAALRRQVVRLLRERRHGGKP